MEQQSLQTFFGASKPRVWGAGPIYDAFPSTFSIFSWNVNGARATIKSGLFSSFLTEFSPTILCVNETKIDETLLNTQKVFASFPSAYAQYWNCCKSKKGYSGTAIFTKVKPTSVQHDFKGHD